VFQRFNVQARSAMERAAEKAQRLGHAYVEPEHLLAGLAADGQASFHQVLSALHVEAGTIEAVGLPPARPAGHASRQPVFSPHARRVLAYTVEEADRLGHKRVGTSHLLLAIIRDATEREGALQGLGIRLEDARARIRELGEEATSSGREDVIPAILFFELDRRARESERALAERIDAMRKEQRRLEEMVTLLADRVAKLETRPPAGRRRRL